MRVFFALILGAALGSCLQIYYGLGSSVLHHTLSVVSIVSYGYVSLLKMIIMPLILVSIVAAIVKVRDTGAALGKISVVSISLLLAMTAASAAIGITMASLFHLDASGIVAGTREIAQGHALQTHLTSIKGLSFTDMIKAFFPQNPFADLAGERPTSTIAVVIFSVFLGLACVRVINQDSKFSQGLESFILSAQEVVRALVHLVLSFTPYGVLALMIGVAANSDANAIESLAHFVMASYLGLLLIVIMHLILVSLVRVNPLDYIKKVLPVLAFAFTSRSSAAAIPLNIETQVEKLGNGDAVSNFTASFGATMGQNGCAGLYPAMLAMMIAPTVGIDPLTPGFLFTLIITIVIASFGSAGIGGGATFAALIVLSAMNLPVALAGLLISIEPLIDMGRTAINVNGSMVSGTITARALGMAEPPRVEDIDELT
ncbi:L-cystine uptake protein TcyP [BD1-7 clade bacterium]|uniref:L-cystine uptake protein TcyP n=1 Tax=BD1-7 clade bacterium TaxID=2029982 RepID=A0A5S9Q5I9_9GAMM|nr:L-cystine uptake protein TcyP [BD1-7 clade bacterium]CAA0112257.1 L-cystine uptake protein TcyP [BD1-7 clade bacterium]